MLLIISLHNKVLKVWLLIWNMHQICVANIRCQNITDMCYFESRIYTEERLDLIANNFNLTFSFNISHVVVLKHNMLTWLIGQKSSKDSFLKTYFIIEIFTTYFFWYMVKKCILFIFLNLFDVPNEVIIIMQPLFFQLT